MKRWKQWRARRQTADTAWRAVSNPEVSTEGEVGS